MDTKHVIVSLLLPLIAPCWLEWEVRDRGRDTEQSWPASGAERQHAVARHQGHCQSPLNVCQCPQSSLNSFELKILNSSKHFRRLSADFNAMLLRNRLFVTTFSVEKGRHSPTNQFSVFCLLAATESQTSMRSTNKIYTAHVLIHRCELWHVSSSRHLNILIAQRDVKVLLHLPPHLSDRDLNLNEWISE